MFLILKENFQEQNIQAFNQPWEQFAHLFMTSNQSIIIDFIN